jgi:hypothetical protein
MNEINEERAALRGQMAVKSRELSELELKADGAASLLRRELSAIRKPHAFDSEKIGVLSRQLCEYIDGIKETAEYLERLENDLNG